MLNRSAAPLGSGTYERVGAQKCPADDIFGAKLCDVVSRQPEIDRDAARRVLHQLRLR